ncbi:mechanosensitive ion channel family protein [Maridesulfovibrio ferrireducens]|uniref:mechanosensitive ion channel family protein n=1 Tax=Maridesulfovibrio ferrireducens TaxID=246191 RepID=UPI001A22F184|nr:mechanosensitive ion channel domain-containing protein [Maridesulfovibrio ferrireducens]MBI9111774.1 mechanosensitive ion channel [Maridesulfovibrio ferrireducens]
MDISKLENFFRYDLIKWLHELQRSIVKDFFSWHGAIEVVLVPLIFLIGRLFHKRITPKIEASIKNKLPKIVRESLFIKTFLKQIGLIFTVLLFKMSVFIMVSQHYKPGLLVVAGSLTAAWVIIKIASSLVMNQFWARVISTTAWVMAALNVFGLLGKTVAFLDTVGFVYNDKNLSILVIFKGIILLLALIQVATFSNKIAQEKIVKSHSLSPSLQVLLSKASKVGLMTLAVYLGLKGIGVDFTGLTIFSGAVGVGVGFGLQKVISNLVCGVILLLERSIKPGDIIEVGNARGKIKSLNARFIAMETFDKKEYLIPNDSLITGQVINWTYGDNSVRLRIPFGVAYSTDLREAMKASEEAALTVSGVLMTPAPVCRMTGYGASSVDFELRIWIDSPEKGTGRVKSDTMLAIWDSFKEKGIEFPFPQQDIYIKNLPPMVEES